MPLKVVAFDLGGTLVNYYREDEFPRILDKSIANVKDVICKNPEIASCVNCINPMSENHEHADGCVRPLIERVASLFKADAHSLSACQDEIATAFLSPIFDVSYKYNDVDNILSCLRDEGYKIIVVSNTPWGTPSKYWRKELDRFGIAKALEASFFCVDIGWRKPSRRLFSWICKSLNVMPMEIAFIGDHFSWDYQGSKLAGMKPILLNRNINMYADDVVSINSLSHLLPILKAM